MTQGFKEEGCDGSNKSAHSPVGISGKRDVGTVLDCARESTEDTNNDLTTNTTDDQSKAGCSSPMLGMGGGGARVTFDDILLVVGEFGPHQKWLYFLFSVPFVCSSMQLMGWVFVGANLPHRCLLPGEQASNNTITFHGWNLTEENSGGKGAYKKIYLSSTIVNGVKR